jgi:tetratricopeptide (TPR) repeat protein
MGRFAVIVVLLCCGFAQHSAQARVQNQSSALGQAGWEAIRTGKLPEATRLFNEAIAHDPRDGAMPELLLGAGLAAYLQGQETKARTSLTEALRLEPKLTAASLLLGEIAYRAGDIDKAIAIYEAARAFAPDHAQLQSRLESWRKESALHGGFQHALNSHFTVLFEGPPEQALAGRALDLLEAAYWRIGTALLAYPAENVTVILYTDEQFRDITRSPSWAGGVYDGKIRMPMRGALNDLRELERVLSHEFTHALVRSLAPRGVPTWLDEGLAVVFEPGNAGRAEEMVRKAPSLIPLGQLEKSFLKLPADQVPLAYAESALAVRMLLDRSGPLMLATLLNDLAAGREFAEVFERRFLLSYADFQAAWEQRAR